MQPVAAENGGELCVLPDFGRFFQIHQAAETLKFTSGISLK
jgi:hypothetical protein